MVMIRCTCIYRATSSAEKAETGSTITVACRDPHCPASAVHDRAQRARAAAINR